eukprot:jgi/Undpi1/9272/HiC_scaffold_26.g11730.m1
MRMPPNSLRALLAFSAAAATTMDHRSKAVVLGVLGLTTVAVFCVYAVSRRKATARAGLAKQQQQEQSPPKLAVGAKGEEEAAAAVSPAVEGGLGEDETLSAAVAGVAAAAEAARIAGYDADAEKGKEQEKKLEDDIASAMQAPSQLFNRASVNAKKYFREGRYTEAAEQYGIALQHCDNLDNRKSQRTALHNNRGAAFEKAGKYAQALSECVLCLAREPDHPLARVRKSRVLEALGRPVDALSEVCAHLLLERDRFQAKIALNPMMQPEPPTPPRNLEALLQKIANSRADEILAEREKADASKTGVGGGNANAKRKPLMKQAVTELLRSFGSYTELEDIFEAADIMSKLQKESSDGEVGVPADVEASLWEWQGTFLQLELDADGAMEAYERCEARLKAEGREPKADVLIKMAWVHIDKEATEKAKAVFDRAISLYPDYGSIYAHRARLREGSDGDAAVVALLEKALDLSPKDVYAREQLCKLYEEAGAIDTALAAAQKGIADNPDSEALLTLTVWPGGGVGEGVGGGEREWGGRGGVEGAGLHFTLAVKNQDMSAASTIGELFDLAIKASPANAIAYVNKAMFLLQVSFRRGGGGRGSGGGVAEVVVMVVAMLAVVVMMNDVPGAVEVLDKGVKADPTSVSALVQLANLKVMMATSMEHGEVAVRLLEKAVSMCVMREELVETLSVLVATEGRIQAAVLLGRSSLA